MTIRFTTRWLLAIMALVVMVLTWIVVVARYVGDYQRRTPPPTLRPLTFAT